MLTTRPFTSEWPWLSGDSGMVPTVSPCVEAAKHFQCLPPGVAIPDVNPLTGSQVSELPRKTQLRQHLDGATLDSNGEEGEQDQVQ